VRESIKKILHLPVSPNKIEITNITYIKSIIKQLNSLLFFFFLVITFISPSAFTKQATPFTKTTYIDSIVQDNKSFIWLSGQNGLYRFDGKQVINFSNKEKGWSIPFNWIHSISKKNNHLILTSETKGVWLFDTETGKTQLINIDSKTNTFYKAIHHKNSYYAISMGPEHLYRYDIATNKTTLIAKNIKSDHLFASEDRVYFNNNEKLLYLDSSLNNNKIQQVDAIDERIIASTSINNTAIIASKNHLFSVKDNGEIIKKKISSPISAITLYNNQNDNTQNAILSVNLLGEVIKREVATLNLLHSNFPTVEKSKYTTLLHDNSGVLWLGNDRGIQQLTEAKIKNHSVIFDTNSSAIETEIYQDELYLGSYGQGIHKLSPFTKNQASPIKEINQKLSKTAKEITDLLSIDESLFIATFDGLWRYNKKNQQTQKINLTFDNSNLNNLILLKLRYNKNLLYIATDGQGIIIYDLKTKVVIQHINEEAGLSSGEVIDLLPLPTGDIWLATALGIDIVNKQAKTVKNIIHQTSSKFISVLQVEGKIFVTTKGDGIHTYNHQGELLAHFAKGINFSHMAFINGRIFASAKPGLYKINPNNYQFSMVTHTDKFSFTDNAFLFNDALFIPHSSGVLQLPIQSAPTFHPKVYISKTTVSGKSQLLNKSIKVNSANDVITLDLASLDYRPGIDKQYRYTLNNGKWNQINGNQLTLTGLASGNYHIEIMATNSLRQWSKYKAYTEISVAFPWYWTPQMRLIYGVSLFAIILLSAWLLYLHSKSINHIRNLLQSDINYCGKNNTQIKRNLTAALVFITENNLSKSKLLLQQCIDDLNEQQPSSEPCSLDGNSLMEAVPFLANYLKNKYQVKLAYQFELKSNELNYELQADLYRVIFEAITSAILNDNGRNFKVVLQKFKGKIWLNISDDNQSFIHFNSKINFDISKYYIRQIASKYYGSINAFGEQGNTSQLILSLPLMHKK